MMDVLFTAAGLAQSLVEHLPAEQEVAGSSRPSSCSNDNTQFAVSPSPCT